MSSYKLLRWERLLRNILYILICLKCVLCVPDKLISRQNASLPLLKFVEIISKYYYLIFNGAVDNFTVAVRLAAGSVSAVT